MHSIPVCFLFPFLLFLTWKTVAQAVRELKGGVAACQNKKREVMRHSGVCACRLTRLCLFVLFSFFSGKKVVDECR